VLRFAALSYVIKGLVTSASFVKRKLTIAVSGYPAFAVPLNEEITVANSCNSILAFEPFTTFSPGA